MPIRPLILFLALLAPILRADEAKSARRIVDRAIAASGGAKRLAEQQSLSGTSRGTVTLGGAQRTVENAWTVEGPDKLKWAADVTQGDQTLNIVLVLDGKRGWIKGNSGEAQGLKADLLAPLRHGFAGLRLAETLTPLLDRGTKLSHLGGLKVEDRPTVGIKVKRKGSPDLDMYFDEKTHLPAKAEMRLTELGDAEATYSAFFGEYERVNGRMVFTRLTVRRDGEIVLTMLRSNVEAKAKAAEGTFAKP
jgi:hypothetical protein